MIGYPLS